jgi:hypothetical protein
MVNKKSILMPALFSLAVATTAASAGNNTDSDLIFADGMIGKCSVGLGLGDNTIQSRLGCNFKGLEIMLTHSESTTPYEIPEYGATTTKITEKDYIEFMYNSGQWKGGIGFSTHSEKFYQNYFDVINKADSGEGITFTVPNKDHPIKTNISFDYFLPKGDIVGIDFTDSSATLKYTWQIGTTNDRIGITKNIFKPKPFKHEIEGLEYYDNGTGL